MILKAAFVSLVSVAMVQAAEVKVEFSFSEATSKAFAETLMMAKADIEEVRIEAVASSAPLTKAICTARVLKPDWSLEESESFSPDSRIECDVEQASLKGKVILDLSRIGIRRHGNRISHKKAFAIEGPLSDKLLKALLIYKKANPTNEIMRSSHGEFATKMDAMIDANIRFDLGEDLVAIDCYRFMHLTPEKEWVPDLQQCAFSTKER